MIRPSYVFFALLLFLLIVYTHHTKTTYANILSLRTLRTLHNEACYCILHNRPILLVLVFGGPSAGGHLHQVGSVTAKVLLGCLHSR